MKIELKYFTGTGNSLKIMNVCRDVFTGSDHITGISEISLKEKRIADCDILGLCFPVYAFGIPRICRNYLKSLERFDNKQKVFVLITAGDDDESGFSIRDCEKILRKKNCDIIYTDVIQMPINWITSPEPPFPPSREEAAEIIRNGAAHAGSIAAEILNGIRKYHVFNYPKRYTKIRFYKDFWLFKYLGISNMWRLFKTYDSCNGCGICSKICPTQSIAMIHKLPVWSSTCEQCMRCVNFCPNEAIFQTHGGDTKGKNRYFEPGFKPLKSY